MGVLDKGMIHMLSGTEWGWYEITILSVRMAQNLKPKLFI